MTTSEQTLTLTMTTIQPRARCPRCHHPPTRSHSRYVRTRADLPWLGNAVRVELQARRFFCAQPACPQQICCERWPAVVAPDARRTRRLAHGLQVLGSALGGEAGARVARALMRCTSPDTLLRCIRRAVLPPPTTPRVLGVDDWAKRKGQSYGTILVDVERRAPIELLPDREAQTRQPWLQAQPGVELISRDRAAQYAEGARAGAPQTVQVADRCHVLKNLGEAGKRVLTRQRASVEHAARPMRTEQIGQLPTAGELSVRVSARPEAEIEQHRATRSAHSCAVKRLQDQGVSQVGIARTLRMTHATVRRFRRASIFPERARYRHGSRLDPSLPDLSQRRAQGMRNSLPLWREVRAQGYPGAPRMLERYVLRIGQRLQGKRSSHGVLSFR
jgi:transposase